MPLGLLNPVVELDSICRDVDIKSIETGDDVPDPVSIELVQRERLDLANAHVTLIIWALTTFGPSLELLLYFGNHFTGVDEGVG